MTKMYMIRIGFRGPLKLEMQEFSRVTEHYVFMQNGRREGRISAFGMWFPTPEEAIAHRRATITERISVLERSIGSSRKELSDLEQIEVTA